MVFVNIWISLVFFWKGYFAMSLSMFKRHIVQHSLQSPMTVLVILNRNCIFIRISNQSSNGLFYHTRANNACFAPWIKLDFLVTNVNEENCIYGVEWDINTELVIMSLWNLTQILNH